MRLLKLASSAATAAVSAAATASAITTTMPPAATAGSASSPATVSTAITATLRAIASSLRRRLDAVEIGLIAFFKLSAAFESQSRRARRNRSRFGLNLAAQGLCGRWCASPHLRALLFQNCLARKADAVAFDRQDFHQHLVAFLQFVANIFNAMFGNFADVQQAFGSRNDFDERAEIRQPSDFAEISLAYFGGRRDVAE